LGADLYTKKLNQHGDFELFAISPLANNRSSGETAMD
jgi:hypothetical protein